MATVSQIASQAVRVGHGDRRPGRGSSDKEAPALTGLRREIRAQGCRWMTLSYCTRWGMAGVGPGEQDGSGVGVRTGTEAHTGTVVGLLDRKAVMRRHVRRETGKATLGPATTPTPHPVRLMLPPNLLPGRRD